MFYLKNNKLHGRLESYDINGNLVVIGEFNKGKTEYTLLKSFEM